jgi:hypothetical protein
MLITMMVMRVREFWASVGVDANMCLVHGTGSGNPYGFLPGVNRVRVRVQYF